MSETKDIPIVVVERIPFWLAVALTVLVSMPFGLWLGEYNFALWCAFIVWAEYFALGAKPEAMKVVIPSFCYAAFITAITLTLTPFLDFLPDVCTSGDLTITVGLFVGVCFLVYSMRWSDTFKQGSLPFFNGMSMALGLYFTGSFPEMGIVPGPFAAAIWASVMCLFGCFLGWFNVTITFPLEKNDFGEDET